MKEHDNSSASQRQRILRHLREKGSLTTLQSGMRICELRKDGYPIKMVWVNDLTPEGCPHRVGKYFLDAGPQLSLLDLPILKREVSR